MSLWGKSCQRGATLASLKRGTCGRCTCEQMGCWLSPWEDILSGPPKDWHRWWCWSCGFLGVHALRSWSIYMYIRVHRYGHSYDLRFTWLERGVLSTFPLGFGVGSGFGCWGKVRAGVILAAYRVWECGEMCVMGWKNVWWRWSKTWWSIIIKSCWTWIGNLQPYIGLFIYPCIPLTTKHTQKHRVGDSGQYKSYW
jgi:hypothetical protein